MSTRNMTWFQRMTLPLLSMGPLFSMYVIGAQSGGVYLPSDAAAVVLVAVLLFWSPLPFSLPALIMSTYRDEYLPKTRATSRAVGLLPYLHRHSVGVRAQLWASIAGFLLGAVYLATNLA